MTAGREELARLADEQAALRRVATLVARGVPPPDVFAAVAGEVGLLLGVEATHMGRFETDGTVTGVASWSLGGRTEAPVGTRVTLEGDNVAALVLRTGRPARMDSYEDASGEGARLGREMGLGASVGAPIVVDQRLWGVMIASSTHETPLPEDTESRITAFTELVATAISNTEMRTEARRLADEQAALRRVATLVAQDVSQDEVFDAVSREIGTLLDVPFAGMVRYESDQMASIVAAWAAAGEPAPARGERPLERDSLSATILRTGRPARIDDWGGVDAPLAQAAIDELGIVASVGIPIVLDDRVWGALIVHSKDAGPLPRDTESRLTNFAELVATAMFQSQARAEVLRLAEEQAALRRVATLVAQESSPAEVFAKVAQEVRRLLRVDITAIFRYEEDATTSIVATAGDLDDQIPIGDRVPLEGESVNTRVVRTGRSARFDDYATATGPIGTYMRELGIRSAVGSPIIVEGKLWGSICAASRHAEPLAADAEARIGKFTELVATAISNVQARSDLAASRARIVAAADEERRRVVRDLHDGAQQRLVHTVITLKLARRALENGDDDAPALVARALEQAERATSEVRELAHGILPGVLTRGGLRAGVVALASRMSVPVDIAVTTDRLPTAVEATAYFVVAEALTNVAKHARAGRAGVVAQVEDGTLAVKVRDDGVGGARTDGPGLIGLADRLAVLDGTLEVESPVDGGTVVTATIPLPG